MEPLAGIILGIILAVSVGLIIWSTYELGRTRERLNTLNRAREAHRLFFDGPRLSTPNWHSSSDLIAYVSGTKEYPETVTYESFVFPGPPTVTVETDPLD